jgi:predicted AAA+ superfamily ATPase
MRQPAFAETHTTEGMDVLFRQVFDRLTVRGDQGVFRLSQAMGVGKVVRVLPASS